MTGTRRLILPLALVALMGALVTPIRAMACPFCSMQGKTLVGEVNDAAMVLYGTLDNAVAGGGASGEGTTDLKIEAIIKKNDVLGDRKVLKLDRYLPTTDKKVKYLVFCDVFKGRIDPYSGRAVSADSGTDKYLEGALKLKDAPQTERLRFFFDYLDNPETEISTDAYKEFAVADYADYRKMAEKLDEKSVEKVAGWLKNKDTPSFRFGLYGSLLGCTDKNADENARLLRAMLDDKERPISSGVDGILAGYVMLKPQEGWEYVQTVLKDSNREFAMRYAALRTIRFLWQYRPDLVKKDGLAGGAALLLDQNDVADLAIEDLRKWSRWEYTERILSLYDKKSHDVPIIRRQILRYALSCAQQTDSGAEKYHMTAQKFVESLRRTNPDLVKDQEELLKWENNSAPPAPPVSK